MANPVEPVTARDAFDVSPSDTVVFQAIPSAFRIGGAGDLVLVTEMGRTVTIPNCQVGEVIAVRAKQVRASTTASDITAFLY